MLKIQSVLKGEETKHHEGKAAGSKRGKFNKEKGRWELVLKTDRKGWRGGERRDNKAKTSPCLVGGEGGGADAGRKKGLRECV